MFNFFKKKIAESTELQTSQEKEKRDNGGTQIGVGYTITNAAKDMTQAAAKKFAKPATYTGNRTMYDSGAAKRKAKEDLFKSGNPVKDPYTGKDLVLTKKEAKFLYGEDWASHLAESDHVKPLERIYNDTKTISGTQRTIFGQRQTVMIIFEWPQENLIIQREVA